MEQGGGGKAGWGGGGGGSFPFFRGGHQTAGATEAVVFSGVRLHVMKPDQQRGLLAGCLTSQQHAGVSQETDLLRQFYVLSH